VRLTSWILFLFLGIASAVVPSRTEAQSILVYGRGGTLSTSYFPTGATVSVASDAMWRSMTTAQFSQYSMLWVDGNNCGGSPTFLQAFIDTQSTWRGAVTGRVAINLSDPDNHLTGSTTAQTFVRNHATWLTALGATASGGATSLYLSTGCAYYTDAGAPYLDTLEPTFGMSLDHIFVNGEPTAILDPAHPLMSGITLSGLSWGYYGYGAIRTPLPPGWTSLISAHGGSGLFVRTTATTCGNRTIDPGENCDDGNTVSCDGCSSVCRIDSIGCNIGGVCVSNGSVNPANSCERCNTARSTTSYSPEPSGAACDDRQFCTLSDSCDGFGVCRGTSRDCSDTLSCTIDTCDEGADRCTSVVGSGCFIAGRCVSTGTPDPGNPCAVCDPFRSTTSYSPGPVGLSCNDGAFCTERDACNGAGSCTGSPLNCSDAFACTSDRCDESLDVCTNDVFSGCFIDGMCVAEGASNPSNFCERCVSTTSRTSYSAGPAGIRCDDANVCTLEDACNGAGVCSGAALSCDDGLSCTADACDSASGECNNDIVIGCFIDGSCVEEGASDPENLCRVCHSSADPEHYVASAPGDRCGEPSCVDGELTPAGACDTAGNCVAGEPRRCGEGEFAGCADERTCLAGCISDEECESPLLCIGGECVTQPSCGDGPCPDGGLPDGGLPDGSAVGSPDGRRGCCAVFGGPDEPLTGAMLCLLGIALCFARRLRRRG